jgi:hypothetical protein
MANADPFFARYAADLREMLEIAPACHAIAAVNPARGGTSMFPLCADARIVLTAAI